ncbi:uncharacterized protein LOC143975827 [Lithobates pipiens]
MNPGFYLSLLYFLNSAVGADDNFTISLAQKDVAGYENGSILLSVSYHMVTRVSWFQIRWFRLIQTAENPLLICTIRDDGPGQKTITLFPTDGYEKRMKVFPENGSLIIQRLKMEDSGMYRVSMMDNNQTKSFDINVTVNYDQTHGLENAFTMDKAPSLERQFNCSCNNRGVDVPTSAWIILSSRLSSVLITILVFLALHIQGRRAHRQRMLSRLYKYR